MKRDAALVSYSSSEESEPDPQPPKKRKLPTLSATLTGPAHVDDPNLHQGRIRSTPYVEGQFAAHIYASVALDRSSTFFKLLDKIIVSAKKMCPTLHDFWSSEPELHISLSRPIYLRAHQREDMKRAVRRIASQTPPFTASFAQISELVNDEGTRIFLVLEIGAGHHELTALTNLLTPSLHAIRQQEYYAAPRFHASIAWALLGGHAVRSPHTHTNTNAPSPPVSKSIDTPSSNSSNSSTSPAGENELNHPKIAEFPRTLLPSLNEEYGPRLKTSPALKSFDVGEISIKIGKELLRWRLDGPRTGGRGAL